MWPWRARCVTRRARCVPAACRGVPATFRPTEPYKPGYILYTDYHALMIGNRIKTNFIAGKAVQTGYREGVGAEARFSFIYMIHTDIREARRYHVGNHCMRLID